MRVARAPWLLGLVAACLLISPPSPAQDDPSPAAAPKELTVLFTTDLYGRFSELVCDRAVENDFANLVGSIRDATVDLDQRGLPPPLILNGGDNIGPRAAARFILSQGDPGGTLIASWMKRAGYEYIALGNQDLYAVKGRLDAYLKALSAAGIPIGAANLDCADPALGFCPYLNKGFERFALFERAGLKIAVFSIIHGDLENDVNPGHMAGMVVADPIERAQATIDAARKAGADLVIVLAHVEHTETSPRATIKLARSIPDADLVVANAFKANIGDRGIGVIRFTDRASPVIGCDLMGQHLCRADLQLEQREGRWRIAGLKSGELDPASAEPDDEIRGQLHQIRRDYCAKWDRPVGKGKLAAPLDPRAFEQYLLEVMRHSTRSELAFINHGLVAEESVFPIEGQINRHDFFAGLPHRNTLYTFDMGGKQILKLCRQLNREELTGELRLIPRGLTCGLAPKVNGRPVDVNDSYSAVTIEYLARGIGGYFQQSGLALTEFNPDREPEAPILGQLARRFLQGPRFSGPDAEPIDLARNFPDLARQLRWTFLGGLFFNLSDTQIANRRGYEETQLVRDEFRALRGEVRGLIEGDSKLHFVSLDGRLKYARSSTAGSYWIESEDLASIAALYKLKAWHAEDPSWYTPMPYLEATLETEITRPEDDPATVDADEDRGYHHLQLTATIGLRHQLLTPLEAKVGFGVRDQILDDERVPVYGIDLGYRLKKTNLFDVLGSPVQMESELNAFFGDVGRTNTLKGTWTNRLYFSLVGPIYFNITHDFFAYRYSDRGYGLASDLTFGLSYNAQTAVQTF